MGWPATLKGCDEARDTCQEISLLEDLTHQRLKEMQEVISLDFSPGLGVPGWIKAISMVMDKAAMDAVKLAELAKRVGPAHVDDFLAAAILRLMDNYEIVRVTIVSI